MSNIEAPHFQDDEKVVEEVAKADIAEERLNREVPLEVLPIVEEPSEDDSAGGN